MAQLTIRQLNQRIRARYDGASNIRHYQQLNGHGGYVATLATVDEMPNTNQPGRIFVGFTDDLRSSLA